MKYLEGQIKMNDLIVKDLSNALGFLNATLNLRNYGLNACKAYMHVLGCYPMVHHLHIYADLVR